MAQRFWTTIQTILHAPLLRSLWTFIEQKTTINREYIGSILSVLFLVYLAFGKGNDFLCNFVCFLVPAYISLLATQSPTLFDTAKWRIYWLIYTSFRLIECEPFGVISSIPYYWLLKFLFLLWLMISNREDLVYRQIIQVLTKLGASFHGSGSYLIINPPNENVELHVYSTSDARLLAQLRSDPHGRMNVDSLKDGIYTMTAYALGTTPALSLRKFSLRITNGVPNVSHIDVQGTTLHVTFKRRDEPVRAALVQGIFTDVSKTNHNLNGTTDNNGVVKFVLPQGSIHSFAANKDGIEVKKIGGITLQPPAPTQVDVPRPPKEIIVDVDSSSFSSSVNPTTKNARVVILGDISGSMSSGNQMDILRQSFRDIFVRCQKNHWQVALASWDHEIEWCIENRWIENKDSQFVENWIGTREAQGENDMKNALEDCMRRFPNATDVYVMCDGDITPFVLDGGESSWTRFRNQYPKTIFHFIALGEGASFEPMEAMASIGGGTFTHNT